MHTRVQQSIHAEISSFKFWGYEGKSTITSGLRSGSRAAAAAVEPCLGSGGAFNVAAGMIAEAFLDTAEALVVAAGLSGASLALGCSSEGCDGRPWFSRSPSA